MGKGAVRGAVAGEAASEAAGKASGGIGVGEAREAGRAGGFRHREPQHAGEGEAAV